MAEVAVELGERRYTATVGRSALQGLPGILAALAPGRTVVVSSPRVWRHQGPRLARALALSSPPLLMPDGEARKTRRTLDRLQDAFVDAGLRRDGLVLAYGGGVVGDVAGFAAATYMRGVAWVAVPTTLLAMVDASIGGKVGVNHARAKNLIGAFHQPRAVVADLDTLGTLAPRALRSGAYEIVKCGIVADPALFAAMAGAPRALAGWAGLEDAVAAACRVKAVIVASDEREGGPRRALNLGHTVGHALESVTGYRRFTHGEAVGWGLVAAAWIAFARGMIDGSTREAIVDAVDAIGVRPPVADVDEKSILAAIAHDKKARGDRMVFVLPTRIGAVTVVEDVTAAEVRAAWKRITRPSR